MCEQAAERGRGWKGWLELPAVTAAAATEPWIDLSWTIDEDLPRVPAFPAPRISKLRSQPRDPYNATELSMVVHTGTHVDAPRHFFSDGPAFDKIPIDRLAGPGVVWHLSFNMARRMWNSGVDPIVPPA